MSHITSPRFSGLFTVTASNPNCTPHVTQGALRSRAQQIADQVNRKPEGINPGVDLSFPGADQVLFAKHTNNDYSRAKQIDADSAMFTYLEDQGLIQGQHFTYQR